MSDVSRILPVTQLNFMNLQNITIVILFASQVVPIDINRLPTNLLEAMEVIGALKTKLVSNSVFQLTM